MCVFVARLETGRTNFNDVVNTDTARSSLVSGGAPLGCGLVVDDNIGAELAEELLFLGRGGGSDYECAGCFCELYR